MGSANDRVGAPRGRRRARCRSSRLRGVRGGGAPRRLPRRGGFRLGYGIGGEEELLAIDLRASGWDLRYCPQVVAHHHPATERPPGADRRRRQARNAVRTAWLRRRLGSAVRCTAAVGRPAWTDLAVRQGLSDVFGDVAWIWRERIPVDGVLERDLRRL